MSQAIEKIRKSKYKLTPQRLAIVKYLEGNQSHPTAARIYNDLREQYPTMSMATVYNTLHTLSEIGMLQALHVNQGEVHYDPNVEPHCHFSCCQCHMVLDVGEKLPDLPLEDFLKETGHHIDHIAMVMLGVCRTCLQKSKPNH